MTSETDGRAPGDSGDRFKGFGYAVEDQGSPKALDEMLKAVADAGFTHAELDAGLWDVLIAGRVHPRQLARWAAVVEGHSGTLRFTLHGANDLNLFDRAESKLHERLLRATVELAREVHAESIAYHPGVRLVPPAGASTPMLDLMKYEREVLLGVADELSGWGATLGIETWYAVGNVGYSYAIWPDQLAGQVEAIDHPAVGACLDFGHLFLAARWFGFDFLEGVARLAPNVNHFHLHDVHGVLSERESIELGYGDLHLPPGWGAIPFDELFATVDFPRAPVFTIELVRGRKLRLLPYLGDMLSECRRLAALERRAVSIASGN